MTKKFLLQPLLLLTAAVLVWPNSVQAADQPNVILIMTDDQGGWDFGFMGNQVVDTPHLDAMAGRSARMSRSYVSPVLHPHTR